MKAMSRTTLSVFKQAFVAVVTLFFVVGSVNAQRFSRPVTETNTSETEFFSGIITAERVENDIFLEAYSDYQKAVNQFTLHDIYYEEEGGSTASDVYYDFVASVEGEYFELSDSETYMSFVYQEDGSNYAELLFYFVEEELIYIGLTNLQVDISISEFVSNDDLDLWVNEAYTPEDLMNEEFRIAGISQVLFAKAPYYMLMVPTGDNEDDINIDYIIFESDSVIGSYMLEFFYSFEAPQDNMISYFANYLGFSDQKPAPPSE